MLVDEYDIELPASAVVNHGSRQASMRTIRFYDVQMNTAEVQPFVDALRIGGERHGKLAVKRDVNQLPQIKPAPPGWWSPATLPQAQWLDLYPVGHGGGLWVFWSEADGRVLIMRYSM